jgi:hypothetical protein
VKQRCQPRPIDRFEPDALPVELALQDRELMPQGEVSMSLSRLPPGSSRNSANAFVMPR